VLKLLRDISLGLENLLDVLDDLGNRPLLEFTDLLTRLRLPVRLTCKTVRIYTMNEETYSILSASTFVDNWIELF
jgi:hypothetical protein